jgi:hypothetical protein
MSFSEGRSFLSRDESAPAARPSAIQTARPIACRAKVLGRALLATRTDANRLWMLLSRNAEDAFPSTTATTAVAVSLPITPTTRADFPIVAANGASTANAATPTSVALHLNQTASISCWYEFISS